MSEGPDLDDLKRRMDGAISALDKEFQGLRTGRASVNLLEPIMVEAYGSKMPIIQVGTVGVPEPRMLTVQVWDKSMTKAVEKAIRESDLGLNPQVDGQLLRIPLPDLSEERRAELAKVAAKYAESARIAVRNVRRDGMDSLKKAEKDGDLSQDERHLYEEEVQEMTDKFVSRIDDALGHRPEPCGHHHGWQWPVGECARAAPYGRPSAWRGSGATHRRGLDRSRDRLSDVVRVLIGELETAEGGGSRPDGAAASLSEERDRRAA